MFRGPRRRGPWAAALVLALGIAPGLAVLSVLRASLLHPLPYRQPGRLVVARVSMVLGLVPATPGLIEQWAARRDLFSGFGTFAPERTGILRLPAGTQPVQAVAITPGLPATLGVRPEVGIGLSNGSAPQVLLSDGLWRSQFQADRGVIGRAVDISGKSYIVAGVMPPGFIFPRRMHPSWLTLPGVWPKLDLSRADARGGDYYGIGRLRDGISQERAAAALTAALPPVWKNQIHGRVALSGLRDFALEAVAPGLRMATLAVVLVLLLACINAAALLVLEGEHRRSERAIRRRWVRDARASHAG